MQRLQSEVPLAGRKRYLSAAKPVAVWKYAENDSLVFFLVSCELVLRRTTQMENLV